MVATKKGTNCPWVRARVCVSVFMLRADRWRSGCARRRWRRPLCCRAPSFVSDSVMLHGPKLGLLV